MRRILAIAAALVAVSATQTAAETVRQLGPHQHGHGTLNLAVEGQVVQMELEVPGADIVGFEYEAKTVEDQAKVKAATETLSKPLALFTLPDAAGCKVTSSKVAIAKESHDEHEHEEHEHEADHDADDEEHEAEHSEFHVQYALSCDNVAAITTIAFPYFETFPNSQELAVTLITEKSQKSFEVDREHTLIDIRGMM
ncbi:MAG: DUF2796 domain-containing protein [Hyphomicrobiales bacterium]